MHAHTHTYICTHIHRCTHTCTHTHTQMPTCSANCTLTTVSLSSNSSFVLGFCFFMALRTSECGQLCHWNSRSIYNTTQHNTTCEPQWHKCASVCVLVNLVKWNSSSRTTRRCYTKYRFLVGDSFRAVTEQNCCLEGLDFESWCSQAVVLIWLMCQCWAISFILRCSNHSEEMMSTVTPFHLVCMPGEVKYPTQGNEKVLCTHRAENLFSTKLYDRKIYKLLWLCIRLKMLQEPWCLSHKSTKMVTKMAAKRTNMAASWNKMAAKWTQRPGSTLTLLRATMKGVLRCLSRLIDSIVCGSSPCIMSTTRIAMSHSEEPRLRRLLKYGALLSLWQIYIKANHFVFTAFKHSTFCTCFLYL